MKNGFQNIIAAGALVVLSACGGGSGGGSTNASGKANAATGPMVKTSGSAITINGMSFDVSRAVINTDGRAATAADLRTGMRVHVHGADDGNTNRASEVDELNEVRGAVTSVSAASTPQSFNIGDVTVIVNSSTVFSDLVPAAFAAIQVGVFVEVDGTRDSAGNIVASFVEGKGVRNPNDPQVDELHGTIASVNAAAMQFDIGTIIVTFTPATTFTPPMKCSAATLATGLKVEVHGAFTAANAFAATRVECDELDDEAGEHASIEGFVMKLNTNARTFTVDGQAVTYTASTEFHGGVVGDLADNVAVEVEGMFDGSTLVASKIEFEH